MIKVLILDFNGIYCKYDRMSKDKIQVALVMIFRNGRLFSEFHLEIKHLEIA